MATVGVIANPASGRDIRRLVAHGSVFSNNEKVNIVRRLLLGLDALGVEQVIGMPDCFHIGRRALEGLELRLRYEELEMYVHDSGHDSQRAAGALRERGAGCIVTLGGTAPTAPWPRPARTSRWWPSPPAPTTSSP